MNTRKSEDGGAAEPASGETLGTRFLIDDPDKGWRVISARQVLAAQRGEVLMPELANRTVRIAHADVGLRSGKLIALRSVTLAEWCIDAEGRVDRTALMAAIAKKLDPQPGLQREHKEKPLQPSAADLDAICKAVGAPRG